MKCRHCHIELKSVPGMIYCMQCHSHYTPFSRLKKFMTDLKFFNFQNESKSKTMLSRFSCDFCNQRMALHIISEVQFESCYKCQQVWFEKGELQKINSKYIPYHHTDSNYTMTEQISKTPLDQFSQYEVYGPTSDFEAQVKRQHWVIFTFIYESILNVILFPIRYLIKNHPLVLFVLIIVFFYFAKKYLA